MRSGGRSSASSNGSGRSKSRSGDSQYYDLVDADERSAFRIETAGQREALLTTLQYHVEGLSIRNTTSVRRSAARSVFVSCTTLPSSVTRYGAVRQHTALIGIDDVMPVLRILGRDGEDEEVLVWLLALAIYLSIRSSDTCSPSNALNLLALASKLLDYEISNPRECIETSAVAVNGCVSEQKLVRSLGNPRLKRKYGSAPTSVPLSSESDYNKDITDEPVTPTKPPRLSKTTSTSPHRDASPSFVKRRKFTSSIALNHSEASLVAGDHDVFSIGSSAGSASPQDIYPPTQEDERIPAKDVLAKHLGCVWTFLPSCETDWCGETKIQQLALCVCYQAMCRIVTASVCDSSLQAIDSAAAKIIVKLQSSKFENKSSFALWLIFGFLEHYFAETRCLSLRTFTSTCSRAMEVTKISLVQLKQLRHCDCNSAKSSVNSSTIDWPVSMLYFSSDREICGLDLLISLVKLLVNATHTLNVSQEVHQDACDGSIASLSEDLLCTLLRFRRDKTTCCSIHEKFAMDLLLCAVTLSCNIFENRVLYNAYPAGDVCDLLEEGFQSECSQFKHIIESTSLVAPSNGVNCDEFIVEEEPDTPASEGAELDGEIIESLIVAAHLSILQFTRSRHDLSSGCTSCWSMHIRVLKAYLALQEKTDSLSALQARQIVAVVRGMEKHMAAGVDDAT